MGEDLLIFAVLTTGAVLIVAHLGRLYRTSVQHRTIREAISRDNSSVPALLQGIEEPQPGTANDDRTGIVLIALALALFLFGLIQGDPDDIRNMSGAALFPGFVGIGLLLRFHFASRRGKHD
ncbi:MAG TPA: hypothetical protein VF582_09215 [Allosphingosinicella sp.]|jgi:hypothetical protein